MISAIDNSFSSTACEHSNCEPNPVNAMPQDAQHGHEQEDQVQISDQARERFGEKSGSDTGIKDEKDLSQEEKREVEKLKKVDQDVKAHENAHMAAGSDVVVGGASYEYARGPDGKMYAVGGEVKIDTSRESSPEATIRKMQKVRRAALAPAQPSAQDRSVAARATQIEAEARIEAQEQKTKEAEEENNHLENQLVDIATYPSYDSNNSSRIGRNLSVMA